MPTQETSLALAPTAELEQCPENVQSFIGEIIREVREVTQGRRNFSLEFTAMKMIAESLSLDPTKPENKEALTNEKIGEIRAQVKTAVQNSYNLTRKKKKKTAEPPAPEEPEQAIFQSILAKLIKTTEPNEVTIAKIKSTIEELNREQLQQLIAELKKTRKSLQEVIDTVRDECVKKRPQETDTTVDQALTHPEQVKTCFTFRSLVTNNPELPTEQQIALLQSGIKLAKEEEIITAAIGMLIRLGGIYGRNGRIDETLETFEEVLRLQAETHHQKPEDIKRTIAVITELKTPIKNRAAPTPAEATSAPPPAPNQSRQPKKLEVTFPTPRTAENVLKACYDLAADRRFDEGETMADMAMRHFVTEEKFEMQKTGFQATKIILAKPSIISSLQTKQLVAASFTLERAKELELAIRCLKELLTRNISPRARETCTGRMAKISAELAAQKRSQSQPAAQPAAVPAPAPTPMPAPTPIPTPTPATTPATPPQPERPRERSQAEMARDTVSELVTFLEGLDKESMAGQLGKGNEPKHQRRERGGNPWKKEEGDSILIIPDDRIEGLTNQLEGILGRSEERLYAEYLVQTGKTDLQGTVERGFLEGIRNGRLKTRLFAQVAQKLAALIE